MRALAHRVSSWQAQHHFELCQRVPESREAGVDIRLVIHLPNVTLPVSSSSIK